MLNLKTLIATTAAAATMAAAPAAAQAGSVRYAHTPSGNITCKAERGAYTNWSLTCTVKSSYTTLRIGRNGRAHEASYKRIAKRGRKLSYDRNYYVGPFRCNSSEDGLACYDPRGPGSLWLSRASSDFYN